MTDTNDRNQTGKPGEPGESGESGESGKGGKGGFGAFSKQYRDRWAANHPNARKGPETGRPTGDAEPGPAPGAPPAGE